MKKVWRRRARRPAGSGTRRLGCTGQAWRGSERREAKGCRPRDGAYRVGLAPRLHQSEEAQSSVHVALLCSLEKSSCDLPRPARPVWHNGNSSQLHTSIMLESAAVGGWEEDDEQLEYGGGPPLRHPHAQRPSRHESRAGQVYSSDALQLQHSMQPPAKVQDEHPRNPPSPCLPCMFRHAPGSWKKSWRMQMSPSLHNCTT